MICYNKYIARAKQVKPTLLKVNKKFKKDLTFALICAII